MIILILHILTSLALLAVVLGVYIPPSALPIPAWFGLAFEWLIALELLCGVSLLFTKHRRWAWL